MASLKVEELRTSVETHAAGVPQAVSSSPARCASTVSSRPATVSHRPAARVLLALPLHGLACMTWMCAWQHAPPTEVHRHDSLVVHLYADVHGGWLPAPGSQALGCGSSSDYEPMASSLVARSRSSSYCRGTRAHCTSADDFSGNN